MTNVEDWHFLQWYQLCRYKTNKCSAGATVLSRHLQRFDGQLWGLVSASLITNNENSQLLLQLSMHQDMNLSIDGGHLSSRATKIVRHEVIQQIQNRDLKNFQSCLLFLATSPVMMEHIRVFLNIIWLLASPFAAYHPLVCIQSCITLLLLELLKQGPTLPRNRHLESGYRETCTMILTTSMQSSS